MIGKKNIENVLRGDTFYQYPFQIVIDGTPLNLTGAVIKMDIKKDVHSNPALSLTSVGSNGISITNAINGQFSIEEQIFTIPAFSYQYDIQITLSNGKVKTYIGGIFQVVDTITQ